MLQQERIFRDMWTQKKPLIREVIVNRMSQHNLRAFSVSRAAEECIQFKTLYELFSQEKNNFFYHIHFQEETQVNKVVYVFKKALHQNKQNHRFCLGEPLVSRSSNNLHVLLRRS